MDYIIKNRGESMELTIHEKNNCFFMCMNYWEGTEFDNIDALGQRFTILLIENGTGIIEINGESRMFIAPAVFCINEQEHVVIKKSNTFIKAILFHPNVINCNFNFENLRKVPESFTISEVQDAYFRQYFLERNEEYYGNISVGSITYKRFDYLYECYKNQVFLQNKENWPCRSRSFLIEILFLIDNIYSDDNMDDFKPITLKDKDIQDILLFMYNNYNKKITISLLTEEFHINRTTLSNKFNSYTGESIISYLNKLRINIASIILRDTELPISEIMERVGFNDSVHFLRTFKKYKTLSPKEYREKYCWMI